MTAEPRYRIVDENPFLSTEEEHGGLAADDAARLWEDLTGESCNEAEEATQMLADRELPQVAWTDPETGREVTLRLEVN